MTLDGLSSRCPQAVAAGRGLMEHLWFAGALLQFPQAWASFGVSLCQRRKRPMHLSP